MIFHETEQSMLGDVSRLFFLKSLLNIETNGDLSVMWRTVMLKDNIFRKR